MYKDIEKQIKKTHRLKMENARFEKKLMAKLGKKKGKKGKKGR